MTLSKHFTRCFKKRLDSFKVKTRTLKTEAVVVPNEQTEDREAVLYVHWPYCAKRCTYCNFNKYISDTVDHERMAKCLEKEARTLIQLAQISTIKSIFFGGGTPSLALPSTISRVIDSVKDHVNFRDGSEVTLEANPTHLTTERLREFKDAGINRLSLGVQALNDEDLKTLGRDHSAKQAIRCLEKARDIFPSHVSMDVMFGRPGQTLEQWKDELNEVVAVCDNHVSLYQLTLERGTPIYKWVESGKCTLPCNDSLADMYNTAVEVLQRNGLNRYEVSNFSKMGFESKHNQAYWNGEDYIGIGPGAHGRFTPVHNTNSVSPVREERVQTLQPGNWMYEVEKFGHATKKVVPQSQMDRLKELLMLSLRTKSGLSSQRWLVLCPQVDLQTLFGNADRVTVLLQNGFLQLDERGLSATSKGITVLDGIISTLLVVMDDEVSFVDS